MDKVGNVIIRTMEDLSRISTNGYAKLRINTDLCDPEEFRSLFNYFSKGTLLEHIDLEVEPLNTKVQCGCGYEQEFEGEHSGYTKCPSCGRFAEIKENAYELVEPDPSKTGMRKSIRF